MDDFSADRGVPTQKMRGQLDVAVADRFADQRAADQMMTGRHGRDDRAGTLQAFQLVPHELGTAAAVQPETEVEPDEDVSRIEPSDQHVADELLRRRARKLLVEGTEHDGIHARTQQQAELFLGSRDLAGKILRVEQAAGRVVERENDCGKPLPTRLCQDPRDQGLVAAVHAVERPEADDAGTQADRPREKVVQVHRAFRPAIRRTPGPASVSGPCWACSQPAVRTEQAVLPFRTRSG